MQPCIALRAICVYIVSVNLAWAWRTHLVVLGLIFNDSGHILHLLAQVFLQVLQDLSPVVPVSTKKTTPTSILHENMYLYCYSTHWWGLYSYTDSTWCAGILHYLLIQGSLVQNVSHFSPQDTLNYEHICKILMSVHQSGHSLLVVDMQYGSNFC